MALHERLRTWLEAARRHTEPSLSNASEYTLDLAHDSRTFWLNWQGGDIVEASTQLACEGLELLALLAMVDKPEWCRAMRVTWRGRVDVRKWVDELPPHTAVKLGVVKCKHDIAWYRDVAVHTGEHWQSIAYVVMRTELEDKMEGANLLRGIAPIRIHLGGHEVIDGEDVTTFLTEILRIAMDEHFGNHNSLSRGTVIVGGYRRPVFRIDEINYELLQCLQEHMAVLQQLAIHGVCLQNLWMEESAITAATVPAYLSEGPKFFAAVRNVEIYDTASVETINGMFSLLLKSDSVRSISVISDAEMGAPQLWRWIFAAYFSPGALRSLEKLVLYFPGLLDIGFDEIAQRFVDVDDVTPALFPTTLMTNNAREANRGIALASAKKFQLTAPPLEQLEENAVLTSVVVDETLTGLRVLEDIEGWVVVVLPGWGRAWIQRQDLVDVRYTPTGDVLCVNTTTAQPRHLLNHLVVRDAPSSDFVIALLTVVGRFVKNLGVTGSVGAPHTLSDAWIHMVMELCPEMEGIEIILGSDADSLIASLSIFSRCYDDGSCHAKRLVVEAHRIIEEPSSFRIFECLTDEHHAMFQTLEVLELTLPRADGYESSLLPAMKTMLERNRVLRHLVVRISSTVGHDLRQSHVVAAVRAHNHELLPIRLAPLDDKRKLAFLSVLSPLHCIGLGHLGLTLSAIYALDADITSRIFDYAAVCRQRLVCLSIGE